MISVEEARRLVAEQALEFEPQRIPLADVAGLVLAEDVTSPINSPPYDKAMMDGYAVVSSDREPVRRVVEEVPAGSVPRRPVTPGTVSRIMTGAPMPEGADAVVPIEQTEAIDNETVRLEKFDLPPGRHVMPLGASVAVNQVVLRKGAILRPIEIAILAEVGRVMVQAWPRPRVAVLPTGNELVPVGERPGVGQISNSNGPMLLSAVAAHGAVPIALPIAPDDRDALRKLVEQGLQADVLMLTGGVSVGKYDLVPQTLDELGVEQVFHRVALRPGKPLWFGDKTDGQHRTLVFGLPGNPVSSLVCFELFVRPALGALAGRGFVGPRRVTARLRAPYEHAGPREACLPAKVSLPWENGVETAEVEILPWHGSADLSALAAANSFAHLSGEPRNFQAGDLISVLIT